MPALHGNPSILRPARRSTCITCQQNLGPAYGVNTGTTVITYLAVFLIQNTQNRDGKAIQLKLDELIKGVEGARTHLVNLESLSDEELEALQEEFKRLNRSHDKSGGQK